MQRRNDIQGLRALAVILVILCHLEFQSGAFRGGYIGVDVFFVISGYIITSLLIREYSRNADANSGYGWISLRAFYFRRVKRIIPVASIVLITTVSSSYFLFNSVKAGWIRNDGLFASIFLANVNLIQQKTDYFSQSISQSPLEHYWSLSVEEQFYMLIPFLILLAVSFHGISIGNFKMWWERRIITLLSIITLCSFAWSVVQTSNNPQSSYFSTLTRAWEIGAGGLLALVMFQRDTRLSKKNANLIAISSLLVLFTSSFVFDENSRFPGYLALVPVCATSILIFVCGTNPLNIISKLLSLRPIVFIGEISFSLYLWHLPVILILGDRFSFSNNPALKNLSLILVTFALTFVTYYYVERPCRKFPIPESWEKLNPQTEAKMSSVYAWLANAGVRRAILGLAIFGVFLGGYKFAALQIYERPVEPTRTELNLDPQLRTLDPSSQSSDIGEISGQTDSSNLKPSSKSMLSLREAAWDEKILQGLSLVQAPNTIRDNLTDLTSDSSFASKSCRVVTSRDFQAISEVTYCESKLTNAPLALFVGNSHGAMLQDPIAQAFNELGYSEIGVFTSSCVISPKLIPVVNGTPARKCKSFASDVSQFIASYKPMLVVVSQDLATSFLNSSGKTVFGPLAEELIRTELQTTIKSYSADSKVILIDSFPKLPRISDCMAPTGYLNTCITNSMSTDLYQQINMKVAQSVGSLVISPLPWICYLGRCPAIINGVLVSPDGRHLTPQFATSIKPLLKGALRSAIQILTSDNPPDKTKISSENGVASKSDLSLEIKNHNQLISNWKFQIDKSVTNLSIKTLSPSFNETAGKDTFKNPDCLEIFTIAGIKISYFNPCLLRGGQKTAVFIGDSHARMLQSVVSEALKLKGYSTYSVSVGSCKIGNVTPVVNSTPTKNCAEYRKIVQALITQLKPEVIVVSEAQHSSSRNYLPAGVTEMSGKATDTVGFWSEYLKALIELKKNANKLIVLGETPSLPKNIANCVDEVGNLSPECVGNPEEFSQTVKESKKATSNAKGFFVDTREWFCNSRVCPAIIENTLVYADQSHISYPIQNKILPLFNSYITSIGL